MHTLYYSTSTGDRGINTYRIPLMHLAPDNKTLLAFSEARKHSSSDSGPKNIAMRRSFNGGANWTDTEFIYKDRDGVKYGSNLGNVIVDMDTKTLFIIFTYCALNCPISETKMISSKDNGMSWSKPVNLSSQIGNFVFIPGPGYGIQVNYTI